MPRPTLPRSPTIPPRVALALLVGAALVAAGCRGKSESDAEASAAATLHERLRTGQFQIGAASDAVEQAIKRMPSLRRTLGPRERETLADLEDMLDSAGATLGEAQGEVPPIEELRTRLAAEDERRLKSIELANDAYRELSDAQGLVDALAEAAPAPSKPPFGAVSGHLDEALDALEEGIQQMGGQVEDPSKEEASPADALQPASPAPPGGRR